MKKIFISYSHCDEKWIDSLVKHLKVLELEELCSVWEDRKIQSGQLWKDEIEKALKEADIAILMVSANFLTSDFIIRQEVPLILERQQTAGLKLIPVIVNPCAWKSISWLSAIQVFPKNGTPLSIQPPQEIDSILSEFVNEIGISMKEMDKDKHEQLAARNATSSVLNKINHASRKQDKMLDLSNSIKKWLLKDFYTEGTFAGQFGGNVDAKQADHLYQIEKGKDQKGKPSYYLTYWGWHATKMILPEMVDVWSSLTINDIMQQFRGKRWIQTDIQDYTYNINYRTIESVRHTARAADILLLIGKELSLVTQVASDLNNAASDLQNPDGGWKEFRNQGEQISSLYSSLYIFHFLSSIRSYPVSLFISESQKKMEEELIEPTNKTEIYLETQWQKNKWKHGAMPWEVSSPVTLIEYAPFSKKPEFLRQVKDSLSELLNPFGRLINPDIGKDWHASEYALTIRIAYALHCAQQRLQEYDNKLEGTINWLRESYCPKLLKDTCDTAFLCELLLKK